MCTRKNIRALQWVKFILILLLLYARALQWVKFILILLLLYGLVKMKFVVGVRLDIYFF